MYRKKLYLVACALVAMVLASCSGPAVTGPTETTFLGKHVQLISSGSSNGTNIVSRLADSGSLSHTNPFVQSVRPVDTTNTDTTKSIIIIVVKKGDTIIIIIIFNRSADFTHSEMGDMTSTTIHDGAGNIVRTLHNVTLQADGTYRAVWDGRDERGWKVAPGLYSASVQAASGGVTQEKFQLQQPAIFASQHTAK